MNLSKDVEPIDELRHLCMKYNQDGSPMVEQFKRGAMKFFYPVQVYITKLLLILGFSSLQATILWCSIGLIASGFLGFGIGIITFLQ